MWMYITASLVGSIFSVVIYIKLSIKMKRYTKLHDDINLLQHTTNKKG